MIAAPLPTSLAVCGAQKTMQAFGQAFLGELPKHIQNLKIPGRLLADGTWRSPLPAQIEQGTAVQQALLDVLTDPVTQYAQEQAELAFEALFDIDGPSVGVLRFFNGWYETHKTTSLVSAKIIMRLAADAVSLPAAEQERYSTVMAHMHEVAKDDFGLGHAGHDGMYTYMTDAFGARGWEADKHAVEECNEFSLFLYNTGLKGHKAAMRSDEHIQSTMDAMMVSVASELWNGCEFNFAAQFIHQKLLSIDASLADDPARLRNAKGFVMGHSSEVENRHGLHALAAVQAFGRAVDLEFETDRLKEVMLDYNKRVGTAFRALYQVLN